MLQNTERERCDFELQAALAANGLSALDQLLNRQQPGEVIYCREVGALVRLISQAERTGRSADA